MKKKLVKFGIILTNPADLVDNTTVFTDDDIEVLSFDTEQERQDFINLNKGESAQPNDTWLKAEIQTYLTNNGIEWKSYWTKAALLAAV
jgi:hypothetical protein